MAYQDDHGGLNPLEQGSTACEQSIGYCQFNSHDMGPLKEALVGEYVSSIDFLFEDFDYTNEHSPSPWGSYSQYVFNVDKFTQNDPNGFQCGSVYLKKYFFLLPKYDRNGVFIDLPFETPSVHPAYENTYCFGE